MRTQCCGANDNSAWVCHDCPITGAAITTTSGSTAPPLTNPPRTEPVSPLVERLLKGAAPLDDPDLNDDAAAELRCLQAEVELMKRRYMEGPTCHGYLMGEPVKFVSACDRWRVENEALRKAARRALASWDNTVLLKSGDGMMQERMECLRDAIGVPT